VPYLARRKRGGNIASNKIYAILCSPFLVLFPPRSAKAARLSRLTINKAAHAADHNVSDLFAALTFRDCFLGE
jgi:hypothetical protein